MRACFDIQATKRQVWDADKGEYSKPEIETVRVQLDIDEGAIARVLGQNAFRNKSKKAAEIGGLVKVRVL